MDLYEDVVTQYRNFAADARSSSPTFEDWASSVADDPEVLAWITTLPLVKQQPNIVFAAARWHGVPAPGGYQSLRDALLGDHGVIRATILTRATQTNEVGRLATLLPAFGLLAGHEPVALVEVGASAGLCLYPDRYGYRWKTDRGTVALGVVADAPVLHCDVSGPAPLPDRLPQVTWRDGIDLNPLDVHDTEAMTWLETLVWPGQDDRRRRLHAAIEVARSDPPHLERGDLLTELPRLVDQASAYGPVVVFHSAVIAYLEVPERAAFDRLMRDLVSAGRCHWVSNEGSKVLPEVTRSGPAAPEAPATFVLGIDGQAVARAHGHGRRLTWLT